MDLELNKYIDFQSIFNALFKQHEDYLYEYEYEAPQNVLLMKFNILHRKTADLLLDECELNDKEIIFVFSHSNNDANESDNRNSTCDYVFTYCRTLDEFTDAEYEQG